MIKSFWYIIVLKEICMKKAMLFFVLLFCFIFGVYAQAVCPHCNKTIGQTLNVLLASRWNAAGNSFGDNIELLLRPR